MHITFMIQLAGNTPESIAGVYIFSLIILN